MKCPRLLKPFKRVWDNEEDDIWSEYTKHSSNEPTEISIDDKLDYLPLSESYGRAMFSFCPVYEGGWLDKLYIMRLQQEEDGYYVLDLDVKVKDFHITSWIFRRDRPNISLNGWCNEHGTIYFHVYVPDDTNQLSFDYFATGRCLNIIFEDRNEG